MAALTNKRWNPQKTIKYFGFPLKAGATAYTGGMCAADPANGWVLPAAPATAGLIVIGQFAQDVDNSASTATTTVQVALQKEIVADWYDNVTGGGAVVASNLFALCYIADDHSVTMTSGSSSQAGRVWGIDSSLGVLVQNIGL